MNPLPTRGILTDMNTVHAIYEDGVFRPSEKVELPEHCKVEFEPRVVENHQWPVPSEAMYAILNERYSSGEHDVAAHHNEHQP